MWPGMKEQYMFDTKEDCCKLFFHIKGKDCVVEDVCLGTVSTLMPPSEAPTSRPTSSLTKEAISCETRSWHPPTNYQKCTNE